MDLIYMVLASIGGGIFASIIGGTNAFVFTGITGLIGLAIQMGGGGDVFLSTIAAGSLFGPHVAFNSGVVALALTKRLVAKDGGPTIDGTNTFLPLYQYKKVLPIVAAGVTGAFAFLLNYWFSNDLKLSLDTIALTIVIFNVMTRLLIGKSGLIPKTEKGKERYKETNKNLLFNAIWGSGLAIVVAYVTIATNNALIGFYVSAVSLILLSVGKDIPATHHISLVTGYAALKFGNIWIAVIFGLLATVLGEYFNKTVNTKADTLIDMPSAIIAFLSFVVLGIL